MENVKKCKTLDKKYFASVFKRGGKTEKKKPKKPPNNKNLKKKPKKKRRQRSVRVCSFRGKWCSFEYQISIVMGK